MLIIANITTTLGGNLNLLNFAIKFLFYHLSANSGNSSNAHFLRVSAYSTLALVATVAL